MLKLVQGAIAILTFVLVSAVLFYIFGNPWDRSVRFNQGDCLKLNLPDVEEWHNSAIVKVSKVGKKSYQVQYWVDYGWTRLTDTWPFSLSMMKVSCPQELEEAK